MNIFLKKIYRGIQNMCDTWAAEMKTVFRDEGLFLFAIVVPLLYPLLYSWIYNNEVARDVPVVVVDQSDSQLSRQFIRQYDASPNVKVAYHCNDMTEARDLVAKQSAYGILYFPSDFESNIMRMEQSHVGVYCDMSMMLTYKAVYSTATAVSQQLNTSIQVKLSKNYTDREDEISSSPMEVEEVQMFNTTDGYGNFVLPPVLVLILQQTLLLSIGLSAGTSRERKKQLGGQQNGGTLSYVGGKSLCYFMIFSVMAVYICLVVPRLFHFTTMVDIFELVPILIPYLLACIFFGLFFSRVVRYRENVILLVVFTSLPLLFLSGVSWPQSAIPMPWQVFSWLFPSTFGIRAFVRMSSMDAILSDVVVEYRALWAQVAIYFIATCVMYKLIRRK